MLKTFETTELLIMIMVILFIAGSIIPEVAKEKYFIHIYFCCDLVVLFTTVFSIGTSEKRANSNVNISLLIINSIIIIFEISAILL